MSMDMSMDMVSMDMDMRMSMYRCAPPPPANVDLSYEEATGTRAPTAHAKRPAVAPSNSSPEQALLGSGVARHSAQRECV